MTEKITTRAIAPRPSTIREEDRSVEFVISSEVPARVFDFDRMDIVDEVLLQSGLRLPSNKQVPFQDSHSRESVSDVLGSFRDIRREGDQSVGRAYFSRKQKAFDAYQDVRDGHITDVSVGYVVTKATWVPDGQRAMIEGREYVGPVKVSQEWLLREVSLVAIGADQYAKVRSEAQPQQEQQSNGQQAVTEIQQEETPMSEPNTPVTPPAVDTDKIVAEATRKERERVSEIRSACANAGMTEKVDEFIASGRSADEIRKEIIANLKPSTPISGTRFDMGNTDGEKFTRAATDAMLIRALGPRAVEKPAEGAAQMRAIGFEALARECLRRAGISVGLISKEEVIRQALKLRSSSSVPSMNTGDFTYILADVATKALMVGWNMAPTTYQLWCRIGDLPDFKAARRVRLSDAPDMLQVNEGSEVTHGTMSDTGESIGLVTYARKLVLSRQCLLNDDLGSFDAIFAAFGARAANLVNSLPYAVLAANAALADTGLLFNTTAVSTAGGHANLASSGAAISTDTLAAGIAAMFAQAAPNGSKLNIMPRFLLTGGAYMTQAQIVTGSAALATAEYSAGVKNPFNVLAPIADANISGNAWYLAADPMIAPTVEVAFLNGQRQPTLTQEDTSPILGVDFTGLIDVTAKALDFRGLYKNAGA